jgi:homoserine kinase
MPSFVVTVPATTGNLGPGFDCLGAALTLYNKFRFSVSTEAQITASGAYAQQVDLDQTNLVYQSLVKFYDHIGIAIPPIALHVEAEIPMARGLGSSATAIVGGIVGGNLLAGSPLSQKQLLDLAIAIEGHPDNVTPAMLGGCQLSTSRQDGGWEFCRLGWHRSIAIALAIPNFELSTAKARQVLPKQVTMADAIFNASHLALLTHAVIAGNPSWLRTALQDKLHQPYRQSLIVGMENVEKAAIAHGAYGMVISGAGPTLLALGNTTNIEAIALAMVNAWQEEGISAIKKCLAIAHDGTTCTMA